MKHFSIKLGSTKQEIDSILENCSDALPVPERYDHTYVVYTLSTGKTVCNRITATAEEEEDRSDSKKRLAFCN
jgi:hypothetical protein